MAQPQRTSGTADAGGRPVRHRSGAVAGAFLPGGETPGPETPEPETSGPETSGSDAAGPDAAGTEAAGREVSTGRGACTALEATASRGARA